MEEERPEYAESIQVGKRRSSLGALSKSKPVTKLKSMFEAKGAVPRHKDGGLLSKLHPVSASHDASSFSAAVFASFSASGPQTISFPAPVDFPPATPTQPLFSLLPPPPEQDAAPNPSPPLSTEDIRTSPACYNDSIHDGSEADARSAKSPGSAGFLKRMRSSLKRALTPKSSSGKQKRGGGSSSYAGSEVSSLSPRPSAQLLLTPTSLPSSTSLDLNCRSDQMKSAPPRSPSASMGYEAHSAHEDQDWANERSREGSVDVTSRPTPVPPRPPLSPMSLTPGAPVPDGVASQLAASPPHSVSFDAALRLSTGASPDQARSPGDGAASGAPLAPEDSFMSADANAAAGCSTVASSAIDAEDSFAASLTASPTVPEGSEPSRSPPMREVNMGADVMALLPPFALPNDHGASSGNDATAGQGGELVFPSLPVAAGAPESDEADLARADADDLHSGAASHVTTSVQTLAMGPADVDMAACEAVPADNGPATASGGDSILATSNPDAATTGVITAAESTDFDMDELPAPMEAEVSEEPSFNPTQLLSRHTYAAAASVSLDLSGAVTGSSSPSSPDTTTPTTFGATTTDSCIIGLTPVRPDTTVSTSTNLRTDRPALSTVAEASPEAAEFPPVPHSPSDQVNTSGDEEPQERSAANLDTADGGCGAPADSQPVPTVGENFNASCATGAASTSVPQVVADDMDWDDGPAPSASVTKVMPSQQPSSAAAMATPAEPAFVEPAADHSVQELDHATAAAIALELPSAADGASPATSCMDMGTTTIEAANRDVVSGQPGTAANTQPATVALPPQIVYYISGSGNAPDSPQAAVASSPAVERTSSPCAVTCVTASEEATAAPTSVQMATSANDEDQAADAMCSSPGSAAARPVAAPTAAAPVDHSLATGALAPSEAAEASVASPGISFKPLPGDAVAAVTELTGPEREQPNAEPTEPAKADIESEEAGLASTVLIPPQMEAEVAESVVEAPDVANLAGAASEDATSAVDVDMEDAPVCGVNPSESDTQAEEALDVVSMPAVLLQAEGNAAPDAGTFIATIPSADDLATALQIDCGAAESALPATPAQGQQDVVPDFGVEVEVVPAVAAEASLPGVAIETELLCQPPALEQTMPEPPRSEPEHGQMGDSVDANNSNDGSSEQHALEVVPDITAPHLDGSSAEATVPLDEPDGDDPAAADAIPLPVSDNDPAAPPVELVLPSAFEEAVAEAIAAAAAAGSAELPGQQFPVENLDVDMDCMEVDSSAAADTGTLLQPAQSAATPNEVSYASEGSELQPEGPIVVQPPVQDVTQVLERSVSLAEAACVAHQHPAAESSGAPEQVEQPGGALVAPAASAVAISMSSTPPPMQLPQQSVDSDYDIVAYGSAASNMSHLDTAIAAAATIDPEYAKLLASPPLRAATATANVEELALAVGAATADTIPAPSGSQVKLSGPGSPPEQAPQSDAPVEDDPMMVSPIPQRLSKLPPSLNLVPIQALPPVSPDAGALNAPASAAHSTGTPGMPTPISPETARLGVRAFQLDDIDEPEAAPEAQATTAAAAEEDVAPQVLAITIAASEQEPPVTSPAESVALHGGEVEEASLPAEPLPVAGGLNEPVSALVVEGDCAMGEDAQCDGAVTAAAPPVNVDVPMADSLEAIEALWGNDDLLAEGGEGEDGFGLPLPLPQAASSPVKQVEAPSQLHAVRKVAPDVVLQVERESLDLFSLRNSCVGRVSDSLMVESLDSFEGAGICAKSRAVAFVPMAPLNEANEQDVDEDSSSPVDFERLSGTEGASGSTGPPSPNLTFAAINGGSSTSDGMLTPGLQPAGAGTPSACKPAAVGNATRSGANPSSSGGAASHGKPGANKPVTLTTAARATATPSTALKALAAANAAGSSGGKGVMSKRGTPAAAPHTKPLATPGQAMTGAGAAPSGSRLPGISATPGAGAARAIAGAPSSRPPVPSQAVAATPGVMSARPGFTPRGTFMGLSGIGQAPATGSGRPGPFAQQATAGRPGSGLGLFDTPLILRAAAVPLTDSPFSGCDFDLDTVDISAEASRAIAMLGAGDGSDGGAGPAVSGTRQATPVLAAPGRGAVVAGTPTQSVLETHVLLLTNKLAEAEAGIHQLQEENGMLRDQLSTLQFESNMTNDLDMEREARQFLEQELAVVRHRSDGLDADLRSAHAEAKRREQAAAELLASYQAKEAGWARREAEMEVHMQQMRSELDAARSFAQDADARVTRAEAQSTAATTKCDEETARSRELQVTLGLQAHQLVQVQRGRDEAEAKFQKAMEQLIAAQTSHKKQVVEYEQKIQQQNTIISQFGEYRDRYRQMKQHVADTDQRAALAEAKAKESATGLGMAQVEKQELMRMCNELLTQLEATKAKSGAR